MPAPPFTSEHEELRESVRRFVEAEIAPHVDEWERAGEFPRELFARCGELGFLGLKFPEEYGGQGGGYTHDAIWVEELARSGASGGVSAGLNAHASIATPPILKFGTVEQRERWLPPAIRGELVGALGITEPGAGSDVASLRTRAVRDGDGWIVNGAKTFITNGVRADFMVTACRTTEGGGHGGISFLVIDTSTPGFKVVSNLEKMGWRSSDTAEISLTDVFVPGENLLGEENGGFGLIMANFAWERLVMAIGAIGAMDRLIELSREYAGERQAFGRPIGKFQAIRHRIADMATRTAASRTLTYDTLRRFEAGEPVIREVAMTKLFTQRALVEIADEALQIHGGYGYMAEFEIERALRDARLGPIGGGTDEIIGKTFGL
ncbi:MAG: acyl-CoA dehydrogenase family protein [Solirubrobacterales bacterium]|nr:acyl-CoA dehydrogenase family protein [Solirubrobacterales bacterium]